MAGRRVFLLGGAGFVLGGCFDRPCHERIPAQKAFLDGLTALAKPALASNNPLAVEEAARQSVALADKVGAFSDWCGTIRKIEGTAQTAAVIVATTTAQHHTGQHGAQRQIAYTHRESLPHGPRGPGPRH